MPSGLLRHCLRVTSPVVAIMTILRASVQGDAAGETAHVRSSPSCQAARMRVEVRGIVQGVGFRPFVYHLARKLSLAGLVLNTSQGVLIEVEGGPTALAQFINRLTSEKPVLAEITSVHAGSIQPLG